VSALVDPGDVLDAEVIDCYHPESARAFTYHIDRDRARRIESCQRCPAVLSDTTQRWVTQ